MHVLYLSYDGALDPLGRSQIVPYLVGLADRGHRFDLVTFEKPGRWAQREDREAMAARLEAAGIAWHPLPYHQRLSVASTSFDLARGLALARRLARGPEIQLVHARSYPPALVARRLSRGAGVPYLFDIRGLYPEERVDAGLWRAGGPLFRTAKAAERALLRDAAGVVTLTEASVAVVEERVAAAGGRAVVDVIPTAVDLDRFRPRPAPAEGLRLAYVGSIGTWYLTEEMLAFAQAARHHLAARVRFVVNDPDALRAAMARSGPASPSGGVEIRSVPHEQVPEALEGVSATFAFIRPAPSKVASAATKLAESLASSLPAAVNPGVGDAARVVEAEGVGVVVDPFAPATWPEALARLAALSRDPAVRARCRRVAEARFGLGAAVAAYDRIYRRLAAPRPARPAG